MHKGIDKKESILTVESLILQCFALTLCNTIMRFYCATDVYSEDNCNQHVIKRNQFVCRLISRAVHSSEDSVIQLTQFKITQYLNHVFQAYLKHEFCCLDTSMVIHIHYTQMTETHKFIIIWCLLLNIVQMYKHVMMLSCW